MVKDDRSKGYLKIGGRTVVLDTAPQPVRQETVDALIESTVDNRRDDKHVSRRPLIRKSRSQFQLIRTQVAHGPLIRKQEYEPSRLRISKVFSQRSSEATTDMINDDRNELATTSQPVPSSQESHDPLIEFTANSPRDCRQLSRQSLFRKHGYLPSGPRISKYAARLSSEAMTSSVEVGRNRRIYMRIGGRKILLSTAPQPVRSSQETKDYLVESTANLPRDRQYVPQGPLIRRTEYDPSSLWLRHCVIESLEPPFETMVNMTKRRTDGESTRIRSRTIVPDTALQLLRSPENVQELGKSVEVADYQKPLDDVLDAFEDLYTRTAKDSSNRVQRLSNNFSTSRNFNFTEKHVRSYVTSTVGKRDE